MKRFLSSAYNFYCFIQLQLYQNQGREVSVSVGCGMAPKSTRRMQLAGPCPAPIPQAFRLP